MVNILDVCFKNASVLSVLDKHAQIGAKLSFHCYTIRGTPSPLQQRQDNADRLRGNGKEVIWQWMPKLCTIDKNAKSSKSLRQRQLTPKTRVNVPEIGGLSHSFWTVRCRGGAAQSYHTMSYLGNWWRFAVHFFQKIADIGASLDVQARPSAIFHHRPDHQHVIPSF